MDLIFGSILIPVVLTLSAWGIRHYFILHPRPVIESTPFNRLNSKRELVSGNKLKVKNDGFFRIPPYRIVVKHEAAGFSVLDAFSPSEGDGLDRHQQNEHEIILTIDNGVNTVVGYWFSQVNSLEGEKDSRPCYVLVLELNKSKKEIYRNRRLGYWLARAATRLVDEGEFRPADEELLDACLVHLREPEASKLPKFASSLDPASTHVCHAAGEDVVSVSSDYVEGYGVVKSRTHTLHGFYVTKESAEEALARAGDGFEIRYGSKRAGDNDDFVSSSGQQDT